MAKIKQVSYWFANFLSKEFFILIFYGVEAEEIYLK